MENKKIEQEVNGEVNNNVTTTFVSPLEKCFLDNSSTSSILKNPIEQIAEQSESKWFIHNYGEIKKLIDNGKLCSGDLEFYDCGEFCPHTKDKRTIIKVEEGTLVKKEEVRFCRQWLVKDLYEQLNTLLEHFENILDNNSSLIIEKSKVERENASLKHKVEELEHRLEELEENDIDRDF